MIIESVSQEGRIFIVHLRPGFFERLFGIKPKVKRFIDTGNEYMIGGGRIYRDENNEITGNGSSIAEAIDLFRIRKEFESRSK